MPSILAVYPTSISHSQGFCIAEPILSALKSLTEQSHIRDCPLKSLAGAEWLAYRAKRVSTQKLNKFAIHMRKAKISLDDLKILGIFFFITVAFSFIVYFS